MKLGVGLGLSNIRGGGASVSLAASLSGNTLTFSLASVSGLKAAPEPEVTVFTIAGGDALGSVTAAASPELASTTSGTTTGNGQVVSALGAALDVGAVYLVSYEITAVTGTPGLFFPATNGSPFGTAQNPLKATVGIHSYVVEAEDADTTAIIRQSGAGSITFGFISCRKAEWTADVTLADPEENIAFTISLGTDGPQRSGSTSKRTSGEIYVSPNGSDALGTGSQLHPLQTPSAAMLIAAAGDTVYLRPGVYAPFEVTVSGTVGNPLVITTMLSEERQAIIRGELQQHAAQGGPGSSLPTDQRDGIRIDSQDYVEIRDLTVEWVWRHGIFVVGTEGEQHGNIVIDNCLTQDVGRSGIYVGGNNSDTAIPSAETTTLRTDTVTISNNEVTRTNLEIDIQGFGNVEAISVAASASNIDVTDNYIHDSRQYGIDIKAGVDGFTVSGNRIEDMLNHGIYLDAGQRFVKNGAVFNNTITRCKNGIVLARENGAGVSVGVNEFLSLNTIDIYNNLVTEIDDLGLYFQKHPGDRDSGEIVNIRARFNTFVNCAKAGITRDINIEDFAEAGWTTATQTGNDVSGNLYFTDAPTMDIKADLSGSAGWTASDNFNFANGDGQTPTDPLFTDAAGGDYRLLAASTARDSVAVALAAVPFDTGFDGTARTDVDSDGFVDAGARVNDTPPAISGLPDVSTSYGAAVTIDAAASASGTNLVYSLTGPAWLSINASTGSITGTAPETDVTTSATVTVTNSAGSASDSFAISVVDNPVLAIFDNAEQGIYFENNDASTLFTDTAGTTPVSAPGDAVAYQIDKSGNGNHRNQATVSARPLYALHPVGGVRNELVSTDTLATQNVEVTAVERTLSFQGTGSVTLSGVSTAGPLVGTGADNIVSITFTPAAGTLTLTVSGTVEEAQLEIGTARTAYQTVGSTFLDVSEAGKARLGRLWYNGTSHFMQTTAIAPATDKVQVITGLRKLSDAASGVFMDLGNIETDTGAFRFVAPGSGGASKFRFESRGTQPQKTAATTSLTYNAPVSAVVAGLADIDGNRTALRIDGVDLAENAGDQGTGNYQSLPLYFGARSGSSLFYNGYEDTSIVRFGPNLNTITIETIEDYVATLTPELAP